MAYTVNGPLKRPAVLGLVALAIWLVGLVMGVSALVVGQPVVAAVSVVLVLVAPWFGLAWNLHARLRADDVQLPLRWRGPTYRGLIRARRRWNGVVSLIVSCAISLFRFALWVWIAPRRGIA